MLGKTRRLALLAEGCFNATDAKSAVGVLRYRGSEVVAVIDSTRAGRTAQACAGVGGDVPVVANLEAAAAFEPDTLLIGIAPQGGALPASWRAVVAEALLRGMDVIAGLHTFLADDPELATLAAAKGCALIDVRRPPAARSVATRRAASVDALVVLTVGSDCNVGKMTTALELRAALQEMGVKAAFVATGQTGIFVADRGVAIDAVVSDFVAGAVEDLVVEAARDAEVVLVEGQGSIHHPGYSGVSLALLHGACPDAMILCHQSGRTHLKTGDAGPAPRIRSLIEIVRDHERAASWMAPARVLGLSLNTCSLDDAEAKRAVEHEAHRTGLPVTDPVRYGAQPLAAAIVRRLEERRRRAASA
ncbi:MAG: DUF1611 domain-containing protein [Candidatus Eisenbacteria bacterium]|uniref:DUF1611 domain-containing protein n=1 Tax=Eiseniibacteriota bacterium TaxID=2212470 RepID=A0A933WCC8_UNCEI|nr:DUF1611 domain-containing protein [Candidatus Eisenbacteria bacterium]